MKPRTYLTIIGGVVTFIVAPQLIIIYALIVGAIAIFKAIKESQPYSTLQADPPPLKEVVYMRKTIYGAWAMCSEEEYMEARRNPAKWISWKNYV